MSQPATLSVRIVFALAWLLVPTAGLAAGSTAVTIEVDIGVCGDSRIGLSEDCEGSDLSGASCASLGFASGTLVCSSACDFDTTSCIASANDNASGNTDTESSSNNGESSGNDQDQGVSSSARGNQRNSRATPPGNTGNRSQQLPVPIDDFTRLPTSVADIFSSPANTSDGENVELPPGAGNPGSPPGLERLSLGQGVQPPGLLQRAVGRVVSVVKQAIELITSVVTGGTRQPAVDSERSSAEIAPPLQPPPPSTDVTEQVKGEVQTDSSVIAEATHRAATPTMPRRSIGQWILRGVRSLMSSIKDFFFAVLPLPRM